jgi:2,3-bisphosphoglycerate-independent phosphoglycerate mutase
LDNKAFQPARRPVVLCVLDGWGWSAETKDNAIALAETPVFDRLLTDCPHALLRTSGIDVGLPAGQMGNSEVGHLNLGAGRIVDQDIRRIDASIEDGSLARNPALTAFIAALKSSGGACHLVALISPGGVHSHQDQVAALARAVDAAGVPVAIHALLDGRDTPPRSAGGFMHDFLKDLAGTKNVRIVTVTGRFYAMDRDKRWDRVGQAYAALVSAEGERADDPVAAIAASYARDTGDEFVPPTVIGAYDGMKDDDGILMGNFRADRAREILTALLDTRFDGFERARTVSFAAAIGLVEYSDKLNPLMTTMFLPVPLDAIFAEIVANAGLRQLRIAETEKYAHVTFFFNGGVETPFSGEDRELIPSPRVKTYDLQPEMSAAEVTDRLVAAVRSGAYDFIFVNYANPDMVGHTGMLDAAIKAISTVDRCLGRLEEAVREAGGALLITADHGNAETMTDPVTGAPFTSHTVNDVPVILVNGPAGVGTLRSGRLADVAPTLLELIGLPVPPQMTGESLISKQNRSTDGAARESVSASA